MRRPKKGQTEVTAKSMAMLPNIHLLQHLLDASQDYGTLLNCSAALDEAIHSISKQHVALTNRRDVCQSFLRHIMILQALSGAANGQGSARLKELMEAIRLEAPGCLRLVKGELEGTDDGVDGVLPTSDRPTALSIPQRIERIYLSKNWTQNRIEQSELPHTLFNVATDKHRAFALSVGQAYMKSYEIALTSFATPERGKVQYYEKVVYDYRILERLVTINVGDFVCFAAPEDEPHFLYAFARVDGIMVSRSERNVPRLFFVIEWMSQKWKTLPLLGLTPVVSFKHAAEKRNKKLPRVVGPDMLMSNKKPQLFHNYISLGLTIKNPYALSTI
ncbi:BQ5605_C017g08387 [Microbotryum silenes-dioicae]|uniref:BQ5605_C017g08387 protein n=1 Tax=Microbotryum silenes-dioicae TaxID=796604 RepID=A0A2X0LUJ5_9BASI|nr:BQ5605_C017g08387 [Microbotryum silenes-dioicae]